MMNNRSVIVGRIIVIRVVSLALMNNAWRCIMQMGTMAMLIMFLATAFAVERLFKLLKESAIVSLLLVLSLGCNRQGEGQYHFPVFSREYEGHFEFIGDPLMLDGANHIYLYEDYICLVEPNIQNGSSFHVFDKHDGHPLSDAIYKGRGPGEIMHVASSGIVDGILYVFDDTSRSVMMYDGERVINEDTEQYLGTDTSDLGPFPVYVLFLKDGDWVVIRNASPLVKPESNHVRIERLGLTPGQYSEYPLEDRELTWRLCRNPQVTLSPDGSRFALSSLHGCILEVYSVENGLELLSTNYLLDPDLWMEDGEIVYGQRSMNGISSLASTDDYIIASMSDGKTPDDIVVEKGLLRSPYICFMDWNGKGILRVHTDYDIVRLTYDLSEKVVYAVIKDKEGVLHLGRMDMSRFK
jgi:hypothetical protein